MVGLIIVFLMSLFTWTLFYHYFKTEVYKGRNFKKSTQEASKKTTMPTVDVSVLSLILGLFTFYLGGTMLRSLGIILMIGAFVNAIVNLTLTKGLFILITNDPYVTNHLKLLNIKKELIPSILEGEKESKYKPIFAAKKFSKGRKPVWAIVALASIAAVTGLITFSALPNTSLFNSLETPVQEKVHITITDDSSGIKTVELLKSEVLNQVFEKNGETYETFKYSEDILEKEKTIYNFEDKMDVNYTYYVITLGKNYNLDSDKFYTKEGEEFIEHNNLEEALNEILVPQYIDEMKDESFELTSTVSKTSLLDTGMVFAITYGTIGVMTVYFLLRFKPSKALTYLISTSVSVISVVGIAALTRIPCGNIILVVAIATVAIATIIFDFVLARSKDMNKTEKVTGSNELYRQFNEATLFSFEDNSALFYLAILSLLIFGAFGTSFAGSLFLGSVVGVAYFVLVMLVLCPFIYKFFVEKLSQINLPKIKRKSKKPKVQEKSNEPEEAIFYGIND